MDAVDTLRKELFEILANTPDGALEELNESLGAGLVDINTIVSLERRDRWVSDLVDLIIEQSKVGACLNGLCELIEGFEEASIAYYPNLVAFLADFRNRRNEGTLSSDNLIVMNLCALRLSYRRGFVGTVCPSLADFDDLEASSNFFQLIWTTEMSGSKDFDALDRSA